MDPHFDGVIFQTYASELARRLDQSHPPFCALDVRSVDDFAEGHIPASRNTTPTELSRALPPGTDKGTEFFVIGSGPDDDVVREASLALQVSGVRRIVEFRGGMEEWMAYGLDVARERES